MDLEKRFAVVYLPSEDVFSEIPVSWLTDNNLKCWWPNTINPHSYMRRGEVPNEKTWHLHDVQVDLFCSTLEQARKKAEDPNYTTSSETIEKGRGRRKKKVLKKYSSSSENESSDSDIAMTPPPTPKVIYPKTKKEKISTKSKNIEQNKTDVLNDIAPCTENNNNYSQCTVLPLSSNNTKVDNETSTETGLQYDLQSDIPVLVLNKNGTYENISSDIVLEDETGFQSDPPILFVNNEDVCDAGSKDKMVSAKKIYSQLALITKVCLENKITLKDINRKVDNLIQSTGGIDLNQAETKTKQQLRQKLPMKTIEEIIELDSSSSDEERKVLTATIKSLGGRDPKDHLYRCFSLIFSDHLATKCSWHGQRGNFKVKNLNLTKIIIDTFLSIYKNVTESDIEKYATEWFRLGQQRLNRQKK